MYLKDTSMSSDNPFVLLSKNTQQSQKKKGNKDHEEIPLKKSLYL